MTNQTSAKIEAGLVALTTTLLLTGCLGGQAISKLPEQSEGSEQPAVEQETDIEPSEQETDAYLSEQETVTDEYGTYLRDSKVQMEFKWERGDQTGLPKAEADELKAWVINFIMTETLDSIALDNTAA